MPKGQKSEVGEKRVAANGYHYTRTETKWRLTHHIVAEEKILGRPLSGSEMVVFIGSKTDLSPENLRVIKKGKTTTRRRLAQLEAKRDEINAQIEILQRELNE